jgi:hypothetical protein
MAMGLDRLTTKAREALTAADTATRQHNHQEVTPLHLLEAFSARRAGAVARRRRTGPARIRGNQRVTSADPEST